MTSVEQFQDGGSLRSMHQGGATFCSIRFSGSEGVNPSEIHRRMKMQCGDTCLSLQQVYDWNRKLKSGGSSVADAARSGRPHTADPPEMVVGVERVLRENRCITLDEVFSKLNISPMVQHTISFTTCWDSAKYL